MGKNVLRNVLLWTRSPDANIKAWPRTNLKLPHEKTPPGIRGRGTKQHCLAIGGATLIQNDRQGRIDIALKTVGYFLRRCDAAV
jgi:hypothetical protein